MHRSEILYQTPTPPRADSPMHGANIPAPIAHTVQYPTSTRAESRKTSTLKSPRARSPPPERKIRTLGNAPLHAMALPLPAGLAPSEVGFLCEMELVTVIPRQRLEGLELLGVSVSC